jgi:hypothetical protein
MNSRLINPIVRCERKCDSLVPSPRTWQNMTIYVVLTLFHSLCMSFDAPPKHFILIVVQSVIPLEVVWINPFNLSFNNICLPSCSVKHVCSTRAYVSWRTGENPKTISAWFKLCHPSESRLDAIFWFPFHTNMTLDIEGHWSSFVNLWLLREQRREFRFFSCLNTWLLADQMMGLTGTLVSAWARGEYNVAKSLISLFGTPGPSREYTLGVTEDIE